MCVAWPVGHAGAEELSAFSPSEFDASTSPLATCLFPFRWLKTSNATRTELIFLPVSSAVADDLHIRPGQGRSSHAEFPAEVRSFAPTSSDRVDETDMPITNSSSLSNGRSGKRVRAKGGESKVWSLSMQWLPCSSSFQPNQMSIDRLIRRT